MSGSLHEFPCLLVRQPYASLIVYGLKRIEFRRYATQVKGRVGIAASKGGPLKTQDATLNSVSGEWPRGLVLGTAVLSRAEFWDKSKLEQTAKCQCDVLIHGTPLRVYNAPLGEPVLDVDSAIGRSDWSSWAWTFDDVIPLGTPKKYLHKFRSTWGKVLSE